MSGVAQTVGFSQEWGLGKLITSYSSSAHELLLRFLSVGRSSVVLGLLTAPACSRCSLTGAVDNPWPPPCTRRARPKAFRLTASSKHAVVGCRCAPRPCAVPLGSGTTAGWPFASEPLVTRSNSAAVTRSRHPTQVRTGPARGTSSVLAGSRGSLVTEIPPYPVRAPGVRTDRSAPAAYSRGVSSLQCPPPSCSRAIRRLPTSPRPGPTRAGASPAPVASRRPTWPTGWPGAGSPTSGRAPGPGGADRRDRGRAAGCRGHHPRRAGRPAGEAGLEVVRAAWVRCSARSPTRTPARPSWSSATATRSASPCRRWRGWRCRPFRSPCEVVEVEADADDRVCRAWGPGRSQG